MIIFPAIVLTIIVTGAFLSQEFTKEQINKLVEKEEVGHLTFNEHIKLAKARGKRKIEVPGMRELYPVPESLDAALSRYSTIIAKPTQQVSLLVEDGVIATWTKFKVSETLSSVRSDPAAYRYGFAPTPPSDILPVNQDEILVFRTGGTTTIEGVEVTSVQPGLPKFDDNKTYMLFLTFDPNNQQVARVEVGPRGVFELDDNGKITPLPNIFPNHIGKDLKVRHSESLSSLRNDIRRRRQ
jgi:hypothetical protein